MRWARHVAFKGEREGPERVLVGRPERMGPPGRPRHRREDHIKMNLQEVGWSMDWIDLAKNRDRCVALFNAVTNLRIP
jgi:hypothetical protein